ncbi:MAG: 30S ribosomal protein S8 [Saprospirales bacterium]|nr:MAG: 30S ribosomal protein S8 [Saprospirales bacterium]
MSHSDPIADYLTRIRNAQLAGHRMVEIPLSGIKKKITEILFENGYIFRYKVEENEGPQGVIKIALKYDQKTKEPAIKSLGRISKPGLRKYAGVDEIPRVINGLGLCLVSTSKGVITDKEARRENLGGELICYIY